MLFRHDAAKVESKRSELLAGYNDSRNRNPHVFTRVYVLVVRKTTDTNVLYVRDRRADKSRRAESTAAIRYFAINRIARCGAVFLYV